ncbi:MAG: hypothetical protein ACRDDM_02675 [Paraclostridium sp.]
MGQAKKKYTDLILGSYEREEGIEYNGKIYKDHGTDNLSTRYSLRDCPLCGEKVLEEYEKDSTPGFRDSYTAIVDKKCNCDLKQYYKEKESHILVWCD